MLEWKARPSTSMCTRAQAIAQAPEGWRLPTGREMREMVGARMGRHKLRRTQSYWTSCYWEGPDTLWDSGKFLVSRCMVENGCVDQMDMTGADNDREGTVAWYCRDC